MGLYINRIDHPKVFKNEEGIHEPNQAYFKKDYLSEWVQKQEEKNEQLLQAINGMQTNYQQQADAQSNQWKTIDHRMQKLNAHNFQQEQTAQDVITSQKRLENGMVETHDMLEKEEELSRETLEKVNNLQISNETVTSKLAAQEILQHKLITQMDEVSGLQNQMAAQAARQEVQQADMSERLENQEAMMEKVTRQLDNLRSIIFERADHVVKEIENSYDLTSTFFYNMLTGSKQPLTLLMMRERNEERKQESEQ